MEDIRKGRMSASNMERYAKCPGSWALEQQAPPQPESEDASSGTRIHAVLAGEPCDKLSDAELETAVSCTAREQAIVKEIFGAKRTTVIRHHRLWNTNPAWSGEADVVYHGEGKFLKIDYKTGRNEAPAACDNLQLRALVALVGNDPNYLGYDAVGVAAIIQPWAFPQVSKCVYTREDIKRAQWECNEIVKTALTSETRTPGDHCHYCPAKLICKEFIEWSGAALVETVPQQPTKKTTEAAVQSLAGEKLASALELRSPMKWFLEAIETETKRRLIEYTEDQPPGWSLKSGANVPTITDVAEVANRLHDAYGASWQDITSATGITKGAVEALIGKETGLKGAELNREVDKALEGCVEWRQNSPSLAKVKEPKA